MQLRGERKPSLSPFLASPSTITSLVHLSPHRSRSLADACVTLFLHVDPAAISLRSPRVTLLPLRSSRRCSPRCNGLLVSLRPTSVTNTAQVRHPSRAAPSCFASSTVSSCSTVPPHPPSSSVAPLHRKPFPLYAYFIALLALHFHPRVPPAAFVPLPAALSWSRVNELICQERQVLVEITFDDAGGARWGSCRRFVRDGCSLNLTGRINKRQRMSEASGRYFPEKVVIGLPSFYGTQNAFIAERMARSLRRMPGRFFSDEGGTALERAPRNN